MLFIPWKIDYQDYVNGNKFCNPNSQSYHYNDKQESLHVLNHFARIEESLIKLSHRSKNAEDVHSWFLNMWIQCN